MTRGPSAAPLVEKTPHAAIAPIASTKTMNTTATQNGPINITVAALLSRANPSGSSRVPTTAPVAG